MTINVFIYLSQIIGKPVVDRNGQPLGRLVDMSIRVSEEVYPRAAGLIIARGLIRKEYASVNMDDIQESGDVFRLRIGAQDLVYQTQRPRHDMTFCRDVLDQQVVDTNERKVVRVNDIHLLRVDHQMYLAHVDVGIRGLVRRLGWTGVVDAIMRLFFPQASYLSREDFISWKNTQVLTTARQKNVLRLDVSRKKLAQIPPTDLAEIMEDLDIFEKFSLFKSLDTTTQRKVFTDLATQEKSDLIDQMEDKEAALLLENIPADEATDLLLTLSRGKTMKLLRYMESKVSKRLRKLLGFAKDSAGGLMTTEYLYVKKDACVKDALQMIKDNVQYPGNIYHIYVVDEQHHLLGSASLRRFIHVDPETSILETCFPKNIFVRTDDGMEEIALILEKYKFTAIPVLDKDNVLQGVITSDDVMEELIALAWSKYKEKLR